MNYSNRAKINTHEKSANCAVKDVNTVLLNLLIPLQTSKIEGKNHLYLMNYSNTAKLQYTLIKCKFCC